MTVLLFDFLEAAEPGETRRATARNRLEIEPGAFIELFEN
jgi:hypothetical protein